MPLVLVDGSSYFFRAFHALPPLTNSKGQPTGAIYGVANMIKRLIKDYDTKKIAVVFDAKGKTFRDDWYPEYKANRAPMPDDLKSQFQPLMALLKAMGLPLLIVDGVEADDVIGTLSVQATQQGQDVVISTGDKDMAQLVNDHITLINTMSSQALDSEGVVKKFGVRPEQIIDYLTLVGDTADNIRGVMKCGPKTAAKWLSKYETLDNLIADATSITGNIGENLRASIPNLSLSKKLVTIKTDVDLPMTLSDLVLQDADNNVLLELVKEYEFKHWLKDLLGDNTSPPPQEIAPIIIEKTEIEYALITHISELKKLIEKLKSSAEFCIDTETTSLQAIDAKLVGISVAIGADKPVYIPLAHTDGTPQLSLAEVLPLLKPILEDNSIGKIGQNLKYDFNVFKNYDITLNGITFDTMLESYVLDSGQRRHDMDSLALKYLGYKTIGYNDIAGSGAKQLRFDEIAVAKAAPYAAEDALITLKLHQKLYPALDTKLRAVLQTIEIPLLTVLADIERHGVLIDEKTLKIHGIRLKERIKILAAEAFTLASRDFNLNSPNQIQVILFEELGLPIISKTPKGQPSTAESALQELALDYRLPAVILEYRSLSKLVSTYIDALPMRINSKTGRVHTSYNQAVAATGRLSSSEPNLQNIPVRTEEGRLIRKAFIAPLEHVLLASDYSQIELRIMAHLSQDANLLKAFSNGLDVHTATASEIFSVGIDEVTGEQRRRAKAVNFGLIYGMSAFGLAKQLDVSRQDAQQYIDCYFERYPGVMDYMERTREQAHTQGYVETIFNRRLYLPEINSRNMMRRKAAERTAINAPLQGTAADIIKKAMLAISHWQKEQVAPLAKMIMQVHDELVFEVHKSKIKEARDEIIRIMESTVELSVPLIVSVGVGDNWDDAH